MTNKEQTMLSYMISMSLFFGNITNLLLNMSRENTPISIILGFLLGSIILYLIMKYKLINNNIIILIISSSLFIYIIYNTSILINNFYLHETPMILIILLLLISCFYGLSKKIIGLTRLSELLFFIYILLILIALLGNIKNFQLNNLLPIVININTNTFISSFIIMITSIIPTILLIYLIDNYNIKYIMKGYIFSGITYLLIVISTLSTLGITLSTYFKYSEYIAFKKIQLLNFIERIENIISIYSIIASIVLAITLLLVIKKAIRKHI